MEDAIDHALSQLTEFGTGVDVLECNQCGRLLVNRLPDVGYVSYVPESPESIPKNTHGYCLLSYVPRTCSTCGATIEVALIDDAAECFECGSTISASVDRLGSV